MRHDRTPADLFNGAHVLVLEDEPLILMDLEQTLHEMGCRKVTAVGRATDALNPNRSDSVNLALLDIRLVEGTSYEVAATLRREGIPFVFTSGTDGEDVPAEFAAATFLPKPFAEGALVGILATALTTKFEGSASSKRWMMSDRGANA